MLNGKLPDIAAMSNINRKLREQKLSLFGVPAAQRPYLAAGLEGFCLYVAPDYLRARQVYEQVRYITRAAFLPPRAEVLGFYRVESPELRLGRLDALGAVAAGQADMLIVTVNSLCELFAPKERLLNSYIVLECGGKAATGEVTRALARSGYHRETLVTARGQFALRGDILDIFPVAGEAVRVELFGSEVESIKYIDTENNRSYGTVLERISIPPAYEPVVELDDTGSLIARLEGLATDFKSDGAGAAARRKEIVGEITEILTRGYLDSPLDYIMHMGGCVPITDYLPQGTAVVYDSVKAIYDNCNIVYREFFNRFESLLLSGEVLPASVNQYLNKETVFERLSLPPGGYRLLAYQDITTDNKLFAPDSVEKVKGLPVERYSAKYPVLAKDINDWHANGYKVVIAGRDWDTAVNLKSVLNAEGAYLPVIKADGDTYMGAGGGIIDIEIPNGFVSHDLRLVLLGTYDVLVKRSARIKKGKREVFAAPEVGDYVVHYVHGIGRCEGITKLGGILGTKDYIVLSYQGGDKLYVPVEQTDQLSKFSGTEARLSKIGGAEFAKTKERVKSGVKKMAFDLIELYARREAQKGHAYNIDYEAMRSFEDRFPHAPTDDQLAAVAEIMSDMQSGKVMDRLLVGDVGFGKTEVALRAAFATILEGKQVAFLSPTTILSEQHYTTVRNRMGEWGIKSAALNRFRTGSEADKIIAGLRKGTINIVSGTHRLLSADVGFADLGLLILDEEQRFGVADKERIKRLREQVNVLSLSATPIPRTLHMSLSGIRDISTLEEPPAERLPVQTFVTELTDGLLSDAIGREVSRGGQVFVVFNRVEGIYQFAARIESLLPSVRVSIAHGAMKKETLERTVEDFYSAGADVLVCTTIIENGIDLPNANTLIVADSDRLGLSQLYQLRGRVGRSNRLAHAYFTYEPNKEVVGEAHKRLSTLMEFTEFGSGFKIAMRDLEIRGAGNVLGREQHGHIEKVGYDMYCRLIREAVTELKGGTSRSERECRVEIEADAYIPDGYMDNSAERMTFYSRVAAIRSSGDRLNLVEELKEVYGEVPKPVMGIINAGLAKGLGTLAGAELVRIDKTSALVEFYEITPELLDTARAMRQSCVLKMEKKPTIVFGGGETYKNVFRFLNKARANDCKNTDN